jgi:hypothetical protein
LQAVLAQFPCPLFGLGPSEWKGVSLVGQVGGLSKPSDIQFLYVDSLEFRSREDHSEVARPLSFP